MLKFRPGLLGLMILQGVALSHWVKKDTRPLEWDQAIHTRVAYEYKDRIDGTSSAGILAPAYFNYPPFYHWMVALSLNRVADVNDAGAYVNFFFLCLLLWGVFELGVIYVGAGPALVAATLIGFYPIVADMARQTMIDLALTALVTISVLGLVKSENFKNIIWSGVFGVVFGLAMLTKWTAFMYLAGPAALVLFLAIKSRHYKGMLVAGALAVVVFAPWYLINLIPMTSRIHHVSGLIPASGVVLSGVLNFLWYPMMLPRQLNLFFLLLALPGLVAVFWRPKLWPLALWFVVSIILFTLIHNRNERYSMPALPALAILSVAWLPSFRKIPLLVIEAVALVFFVSYQYFPGFWPDIELGRRTIPLVNNSPAYAQDWKHRDIIDTIRKCKSVDKPFALVVTVCNTACFHSTTLNVSARRAGVKDFSFVGPSGARPLQFAEFILTKSGDIGPEYTLGELNKFVEFLRKPPSWFGDIYVEVGRWPLPDGSEAVLYQNKPRLKSYFDVGMLNIELSEFTMPHVVAKGVKFRAVPLSAQDTAQGRLKELWLSARVVNYKNFELRNVSIKLSKPQVLVPLLLEKGDIQLLSLESMTPAATVPIAPLLSYAQEKLKWLRDPKVFMDGTRLIVTGTAFHIPLEVRISLIVENNVFKSRLERVALRGIGLPLLMLRSVTDVDFPLTPNREMPFALRAVGIQGDAYELKLLGATP